MFNNPTIQLNITQLNGSLFGDLNGFAMYSSPNTTYYYVMDKVDYKVYILNNEWEYVSFKSFSDPQSMIAIGQSLYMIGSFNAWKVDQDLNILINYDPVGDPAYYRGISYNPANDLIYVVGWNSQEITVFNLNLTLIRRVSTSSYQPLSITESSNKLYVGTSRGIILVYQNESLINQFDGCFGVGNGYLKSILFDQYGYMAISCAYLDKLYLFSKTGSFTGKSITTPSGPSYIGFDSKGRFIQISRYEISIYN